LPALPGHELAFLPLCRFLPPEINLDQLPDVSPQLSAMVEDELMPFEDQNVTNIPEGKSRAVE